MRLIRLSSIHLGEAGHLNLAEIHGRYIADVVRPLVAEERRQLADLSTERWKEETLGFFYRLGTENGFLPETNRETVKRVEPQRYERDLEIYREPPREYLVDLCWRSGYASGEAYRLELALDVKARKKIAILGCAAREIKHLSRGSEEDVFSTFAAYVAKESPEDTEYLLMFVDHDDSLPDSGVRAYCLDSSGHRTELDPTRYG